MRLGAADRLVPAVALLVVIDAVGGAWAVASGLNTWGDAFSGDARMAAPWPMIVFQLIAALAATRARRRVAIVAAVLLALACIVSAVSGFFDGALAAPGMSRAQVGFQIVLVAWTAFVGALAIARVRTLSRSGAPDRT
jgi:hypothetical protein